ncbi:hypothetical protein ITJ64_11985 [Herbiconiux sp. VKM Ac-1786]|uniref:hypothetical protein n=1 Tax=Herbiconiux sp. VKM Ac-1786 TaxID=2783824 RepID=UPI00188B6988|nr:hypothetical protein [Herbiconiux sp. VKM Ac-1786]MBF4573236.1 hypothetical protein [Herbiconiux sp. VKM Ac-1786]
MATASPPSFHPTAPSRLGGETGWASPAGIQPFGELDEHDDTIVTVRFGGPDDPTPRRRPQRPPVITPDSRFAFPAALGRHPPADGPPDADVEPPSRDRSPPPMLEVELIPLESDEDE